mmetsp:Transcript_32331/g.92093  ORF Transcript_32331/g.92093 Transcript_32331/m.92093 type:complete len:133 (-) Transcript_32331:59-457(-)
MVAESASVCDKCEASAFAPEAAASAADVAALAAPPGSDAMVTRALPPTTRPFAVGGASVEGGNAGEEAERGTCRSVDGEEQDGGEAQHAWQMPLPAPSVGGAFWAAEVATNSCADAPLADSWERSLTTPPGF